MGRLRLLTRILLLCLTVGAVSCTQKQILLASYHPPSELTKGLPRLAQDQVLVLIEGTNEVGELDRAAGLYLISESELKVLLKAAQK